MECRTGCTLLLWIFALWITLLLDLTHAFETDEDNNAALEQMKDSKTGLSIGIPYSFTCPRMPKLRFAKVLCGGKMCLIKCNEGFLSNPNNAFIYMCDLNTGDWSTLPKDKTLPWGDCLASRRRMESRLSNIIRPVKQVIKAVKFRDSEKDSAKESNIGNGSKEQFLWDDDDINMTLG